uniref:Polyprenal reductase n=1 Tax=Timema cristinae TaxID=61476 RepID=A0A7R9CEI2_TIMCR|nr:unnamed protein product [Timema cristinae]
MHDVRDSTPPERDVTRFRLRGYREGCDFADKRRTWFRHFYVFAAAYTSVITLVTFQLYFVSGTFTLSPAFSFALDLLASDDRTVKVSAVSCFLSLCLLTIHSWHRLYETWFISVFSDSRINILHYAVGYAHYIGAVAAILAESPGFTDTKGKVVTHHHGIPYGGWFELVSSPHLLAEVIMYLALTIILWGAHTWPFIFLWVLSNQVESALLTHWWYLSKFEDYPKQRKSIIPYVL